MPAKQDGHQSKQAGQSEVIRVLVVASRGVMRKALEDLINQQPDIEVCGLLNDLRNADRWLMREVVPNVVVLDWPAADQLDVRVLTGLLHMYPAARWLAVSLYDDSFSVKQAVDAGVYGYVTKCTVAEMICTAIRALAAGQRYFSPDLLDTLPQSFLKEILA